MSVRSRQRVQKLLAGSQIDLILRSSHFIFSPARTAEPRRRVPRRGRSRPNRPSDPVGRRERRRSAGALPDQPARTVSSSRSPRRRERSSRQSFRLSSINAPIWSIASTFGGGRQARNRRRSKFSLNARGRKSGCVDCVASLPPLLIVAGAAFAVSAGAEVVVGADLEAAARRSGTPSSRCVAPNSSADATRQPTKRLAGLEARKRATPAGVIVLEALSQTLPDDTYLSELRIEGEKVQIAGLTRDAPALIRLIQQSQHFSRATFFAPTTRAPTDARERFHIEAHIEPTFQIAP